MAEPIAMAGADDAVAQVARSIGDLAADEYAIAYGAAAGFQATDTGAALLASFVPAVGDALVAFRGGPCRWCHRTLPAHAIDLNEAGVEVRCDGNDYGRPVATWLAGPAPTSPWRVILAVLIWVGLPLATLGILAWVTPTIAAVTRRRWSWAVAAAVFFAGLLLGMVVPATLGGFIIIVTWFGSATYGGFQVRPWLAGRPTKIAASRNGSAGPRAQRPLVRPPR